MKSKPMEDWDTFEKRVILLEREKGKMVLSKWHEGGIVAAIIGLILIGLYRFAVHLYSIYIIGALLLGLGIAASIIFHLVKSGTAVEVRERERLIRERNSYMRCEYLEGDLPCETGSESGVCRLHGKKLENHPYCIYCQSYSKTQ